MEPSDETLVFACRRGDETAWETLIDRYQRLIYTIPRRSGLDADMAAEVFQRVCMTLLRKIDSIEQPSRVGAWLVTTARRETWRISRRARAGGVSLEQAFAGDEDEPVELPDDAPLPEDVLERIEAQHAVRSAVSELDERCRKLIVLLFYRDDMPSYAEIAEQLGTSEGSIGPTRARCLQKLRRLIDTAKEQIY